MANEFGAAHRKLVQDTNSGNVEAPPKAATTSINVTGRTHQVYGSDGKNDLTQQLLKTAMQVTGKVIERKKEIDYAKGYDQGLEEGFEENERSPLRDMLFGKSATLRGAQDRIVETDSRNWLNMRMKHLKDDSKQFNEEQYKEYLTQELQSSLEDHKDPEMRASIKKQATSQFQTLARNHAQQRQGWIDLENNQAVEDQMEAGINGMVSASKYGDTKSQQEAMDVTEAMFRKPATMDREVWLEAVNRVMIRNLGKGQDVALRHAEQAGIVEQLRPEEQRKLGIAKELYDSQQGRDFHQSEAVLLGRIKSGKATDSEITAHQQKWPSRVQANTLRDLKLKTDATLSLIQKEQAEATNAFISGDVVWNDYTPAQQKQSVADHFDSMSSDGLAQVRAEAIEAGTYRGDPNAPFTVRQKEDYMLENPYMYASAAAQHPETKYAVVENMATRLMYDIRNESLTEEDIPAVQKKMEFLETFKSLMGNNFQKQFRSVDDAANYAVYSGLVKDAGFHPVNAMRDMRRIASQGDVVIADYAERIADTIDDIEEDFLDASPESQGIDGMWYATDEFDNTLTDEISRKMTKYTEMYKGDLVKAQYATKADIRRNGVVSNGQFVEGGANVNIRGGSLEDYIRGINADDGMRAQITNLKLGFAADADYTSMKLTTDPFNKQNIILHSVHEVTGHPISVVLNTPTKGSQFGTYGVNSFTGYNPHIVNREDRIGTMLKDNVLLKGHRTVGRIVDKAID